MIDPATIIQFLSNSSYFILLILLIIEGPIVTVVASFFASQGNFNILLVFLLAVLGDLIADAFLFFTGRLGKTQLFQKHIKKQYLGKKQLDNLKQKLSTNPFKALTFIKITPPIAAPGLILAGSTSISATKYFSYTILISIINKTFYASLGYFSGMSVFFIINNIEYIQIAIPIAIILIFIIGIGAIKLHKLLTSKIKKHTK